jgi:hypothetical protein
MDFPEPLRPHDEERIVKSERSRGKAPESLDDNLGDGCGFHIKVSSLGLRLEYLLIARQLPSEGNERLKRASLRQLSLDIWN